MEWNGMQCNANVWSQSWMFGKMGGFSIFCFVLLFLQRFITRKKRSSNNIRQETTEVTKKVVYFLFCRFVLFFLSLPSFSNRLHFHPSNEPFVSILIFILFNSEKKKFKKKLFYSLIWDLFVSERKLYSYLTKMWLSRKSL